MKFLNDVDFTLNNAQNHVLDVLDGFPASPVEGQIFYYTADKLPFYYNGSSWMALVDMATAQAIINKRVVPRSSIQESTASLTPTFVDYDFYSITALAADITINNPTGSFFDGQRMTIRIKDDGTSRSITWGDEYVAISGSLPAATIVGQTLVMECITNYTTEMYEVFVLEGSSGGMDITELNTFYVAYDDVTPFACTAADTYEDVIDITGKGFLKAAVFHCYTSETNSRIKITVDGSVIFAGKLKRYYPSGIVPHSSVRVHTSGTTSLKTYEYSSKYVLNSSYTISSAVNFKSLPHTDDTAVDMLHILDTPIFFNTSLSIEFAAGFTSHKMVGYIEGAYM